MVSASFLASAAALLAVGATAPTEAKGFSIKQVPTNRGFMINGVQKTAQVYKKFGKEMPAAVSAAAATQTGTVTATPGQYDEQYTCPVTIGGKSITLDFDTGSADLYVAPSLSESSTSLTEKVGFLLAVAF